MSAINTVMWTQHLQHLQKVSLSGGLLVTLHVLPKLKYKASWNKLCMAIQLNQSQTEQKKKKILELFDAS